MRVDTSDSIGRALVAIHQKRKPTRKSRNISQDVRRHIVKELKKGDKLQYEIADEFGVSQQAVSKIKKKHLQDDMKPRNYLTDDEEKAILILKHNGFSTGFVCRYFNVSASKVKRIARGE